jgi:hypothetical protein
MNNYNYNGRKVIQPKYLTSSQENNYKCEPENICNNIGNRSEYDKIQFNYIVNNQQIPYKIDNSTNQENYLKPIKKN